MKKDWRGNKDYIILALVGITAFILVLIFLCPEKDKIIQAELIVILICITWYYAIHTQKQVELSKNLLDEQTLKRYLEFNERRLHLFYNLFIKHLDEAIDNFDKKRIKETKDFLEIPRRKIFWLYLYMLQKETREMVSRFFLDLIASALCETNGVIEENNKSKLFESLKKMRKKLYEEREIIENYISDNYPFPEKENKKEE